MRQLITIILIFISINSWSQEIPIGQWRYHMPFWQMDYVAKAKSKVYCGAQDGLFYFDTEDNSVNPISKVDGLSDIKVTSLKYHSGVDLLIIGYENGNIDLINDEVIININDIERKNILGSKRINHISINGDIAYLSTDFGVVVLNLVTLEIKETYSNIGPNGIQVQVFSSAVNNDTDSLFIATSIGIMSASNLVTVNKLDFNNWSIFDQGTDSIPTSGVEKIAELNDTIYAAVPGDTLKWFNGNYWEKTNTYLDTLGSIYSMENSNDQLLICSEKYIIQVNSTSSSSVFSYTPYKKPREAYKDGNGTIWVADKNSGLVTNSSGNLSGRYPNGPSSRTSFNISYHNNEILVVGGGYGLGDYLPSFNDINFYLFKEGRWKTRSVWSQNHPGTKSITDGVYNELTGTYYFSSYLTGLMTWDPETEEYTVINDTTTGSSLVPFGGSTVRATDLEIDDDQNIWVATHVSNVGQPSLHRIDPSGAMKGFSFSETNAKVPLEIVIDESNNKWMRLGGTGGLRGIYVFNENEINSSLDDQGKYLSTSNNLPDADVKSIAVDKNGEIWCGTNQGVAVFFNPSQVFTSNIQASTPIFDFRPLLKEESVSAIEVDGGNRKWIGTSNGVWLFNENGTEEIFHFNVDNSPLPSNIILKIEINEVTGEVFFATDEGTVSWRGTATENEGTHSDVKVFPNPVLPDFDGFVGISGLAPNSIVKITDISGKLIYETDANGGTATWDVKGLNNARARTGVYLIYSTSEDGEDAFVAKVAVIE